MKNLLLIVCVETVTEWLIVVLIIQFSEELHIHRLSKIGQDSNQIENIITYLTISAFFYYKQFQ